MFSQLFSPVRACVQNPVKTRHIASAVVSQRLAAYLSNTSNTAGNKKRDLALITTAVAFASFGLSIIYTGYGGTVKIGASKDIFQDQNSQKLEPMQVEFDATVSPSIPWKFVPLQHRLTVMPGSPVLAFYNATNITKETISGVATYNVTPQKAGAYFIKIQCFCFDEQTLGPGESVDMPVYFVVDPKIQQDNNVKDIRSLTLSYTFFRTDNT